MKRQAMIEPTGYTKQHHCDAPAGCYLTSEVVKRLGVSPRQLQWWDERKHVSPLHYAKVRYWRKQDVAEVAIMQELRSRGMGASVIRQLKRRFYVEYRALIAILIAGSPADQIVVASPKSFSAWIDPNAAINAASMYRRAVVFRISARIFAENYRRPREEKRTL